MVLCSWDETGPCAQGLTDAGTQPKAIMSVYLKDIPSFHFLPKGSPHTPRPMEAPSLHRSPHITTAHLTPQQSVWALATSFTDLKPLPSPAAGPRCLQLLQQLCSEAWGCLLRAWSRNEPLVEPDGYKKVKKVKPMQFNLMESEAFPLFFKLLYQSSAGTWSDKQESAASL